MLLQCHSRALVVWTSSYSSKQSSRRHAPFLWVEFGFPALQLHTPTCPPFPQLQYKRTSFAIHTLPDSLPPTSGKHLVPQQFPSIPILTCLCLFPVFLPSAEQLSVSVIFHQMSKLVHSQYPPGSLCTTLPSACSPTYGNTYLNSTSTLSLPFWKASFFPQTRRRPLCYSHGPSVLTSMFSYVP